MNGDNGTSAPHNQQLRALLFTDLCDSLLLVERIGDVAAAELFQEHDRLVLALQQRWNGQLIDRSDGLFMLFERPIDALGFALDYQRGLQPLGQRHEIHLQARAGLHVGDVLTWENSAEAVRAGAKAIEVEGLAKPTAARLMQLARPGQILLSAVAESIVRRSSGSLGAMAEGLQWRSFGRWRFKGVSQPAEVYGVQAAGMPTPGRLRHTAKARRDLPLWRRPLAMAAQAAVLLAAVLGVWLLTRPQPAIAFAERDWVVLGGLHNLTGNRLLDDALDQAFRISLEQSRYVNVVSDDRVGRTLEMMRKPPDRGVRERGDAAAVAVRTGARLVFVPSATDVGGRTRFSVEVVEPSTLRTLAVVSADAKAGAVLAAVDDVSRQLRDRLGEEPALIQRDSQSLPEVTTGSMDALRAFALGQKRYVRGDYKGALAFYQQATEIDPEFALAWLGQTRSHFADADFSRAASVLKKAQRWSRHLTTREALYVRNWTLHLGDPDRATDGWMQMAELYPDYLPAANNAAISLYCENRFSEALPLAQRVAMSQVDLLGVGQDQYGRILLAMGRFDEADRALSVAAASGWQGALMRQATVAAARGDLARSLGLLQKIDASDYHADNIRISVQLDKGDIQAALWNAERGMQRSYAMPGVDRFNFYVPLAVARLQAGQHSSVGPLLDEAIHRTFEGIESVPVVDAVDRIVTAQAAALVGLRMGDARYARQVERRWASLQRKPESAVIREFDAVLGAERLRASGKPLQALQLLEPYLGARSRVQSRVAAMKAARDAGLDAQMLDQKRWLASNPGLAYAEIECSYCLQAMNVLDVREAARPLPAAETRPEG
ncbi:putative peptide modification system cyclase [Stenotrophomonas maltophilia]|uniref:putative peptide modification system cyclase n=1 Tax=Stenotrophomonas maltophilia TaxID=40324 RepID=UPI001E6484A8|nr:putative peptide modification system cyclase [Stenotrophomonas maltophilia]MCD5966008.1 putative peptide modification system cyclase [Stenotrophomonas maltophilia]HEL2984764.1 putative peptide modification system cyclase [Stenotrophomonas maltophilia]